MVASDSNRGAGRYARRDQQRTPRVRNWSRLSAARGRGFRLAVRDDPGPGAQPRVLPGSLRDHHEGVDAAFVLASWAVLHDSAGVHAMEPSADDRVLRIRQGGTQTRRSAEHRVARSVRRRKSGDAELDGAEGAASLSSTASAAASSDVGAAD